MLRVASSSIRDQIAQTLVAQLAQLDGWSVERRDVVTSLTFEGRKAIVNVLGESKRPRGVLTYACTLRLGVTVVAKREDADPVLDGSNECRYLDRSVMDIERAVHAASWPYDVRATLSGHEAAPPAESNLIVAGVEVSVEYEHDFNDPSEYSPAYGGV
jgi:hypothetical protein